MKSPSPPWLPKKGIAPIFGAIFAITIGAFFLGANPGESSEKAAESKSPSPPSSASTVATTEPAVDLSPSQVDSIKIEPVKAFRFPVEKEAVGSVTYDEDPSIIQAESTLVGAAATFELNNKELARAKELYKSKVGVSERELEQAISDQQTAEAALKAARDAVRALGKTDTEIDQMIAIGKVDAASAAHSPLKWIVANVTESDSPLLRIAQPVQAKVLAYPERIFEGQISKIYAAVDPNTHRLAIRSEIADSNDELRAGMLANVVIRIEEPPETMAIAANGVVREADGTMTAWVTKDRRHFVQKIIKTGLRRDDRVQILDGLQRGELLVSDGAVFLSNMLNAAPSD